MHSNRYLEVAERALAAMSAEVDRTGWPTDYRTDFTEHDHRTLRAWPVIASIGFVWILRESGTQLAWGSGPGADALAACFARRDPATGRRLAAGGTVWFTWNGDDLREVDPDRALRFLVERDRIARAKGLEDLRGPYRVA